MAVSLNDNLMTDIFYGNQDNSLLTILDSIEDTENEIKVNYKSPYMDTANLKTFLEKNKKFFTVLTSSWQQVLTQRGRQVYDLRNSQPCRGR